MCAACSGGVTSEEANGPAWSAAAARARSYLEAAGLKSSAAAALAQEIVAGCAADQPGLAQDEAILASLRIARRLLTERPPREAGRGEDGPLAPRDQPLSIRRRAFRSLDRLAPRHLRLRRLLPARAPQRVRRIADAQ